MDSLSKPEVPWQTKPLAAKAARRKDSPPTCCGLVHCAAAGHLRCVEVAGGGAQAGPGGAFRHGDEVASLLSRRVLLSPQLRYAVAVRAAHSLGAHLDRLHHCHRYSASPNPPSCHHFGDLCSLELSELRETLEVLGHSGAFLKRCRVYQVANTLSRE